MGAGSPPPRARAVDTGLIAAGTFGIILWLDNAQGFLTGNGVFKATELKPWISDLASAAADHDPERGQRGALRVDRLSPGLRPHPQPRAGRERDALPSRLQLVLMLAIINEDIMPSYTVTLAAMALEVVRFVRPTPRCACSRCRPCSARLARLPGDGVASYLPGTALSWIPAIGWDLWRYLSLVLIAGLTWAASLELWPRRHEPIARSAVAVFGVTFIAGRSTTSTRSRGTRRCRSTSCRGRRWPGCCIEGGRRAVAVGVAVLTAAAILLLAVWSRAPCAGSTRAGAGCDVLLLRLAHVDLGQLERETGTVASRAQLAALRDTLLHDYVIEPVFTDTVMGSFDRLRRAPRD